MKHSSKIIFGLTSFLLLFSCNQESDVFTVKPSAEKQNSIKELEQIKKILNLSKNLKDLSEKVNTYDINNIVTKKRGTFIVLKNKSLAKRDASERTSVAIDKARKKEVPLDSLPDNSKIPTKEMPKPNPVNIAKVTKKWGYFYDGVDCWIAGYWWNDDVTGVSFFQPADATTQYLNNVCGWANVA